MANSTFPRLAALGFSTLLCLLLAPGAPAGAVEEIEEEHLLSTEFRTPHTPWARPYAGGKVRALFFVDTGYCDTWPREVVELKQRFDLDAQAVWWIQIIDSPQTGWHGGASGLARIRRLLARPWDCYVFINMAPDRLPAEEQYALFEKVTQGAGLVLMGADEPRALKPKNRLPLPPFLAGGVPLPLMPFAQALLPKEATAEQRTQSSLAGAMVAAYPVKQGRGVRLPARPAIPYRPGWEAEYDYWQSLVGRAIFWAAGREPKAALSVAGQEPTMDRASLPGKRAVTVAWDDLPAGTQLSLALRREDGWAQPLRAGRILAPRGTMALPLPSLCAGDYTVDAIARGPKGVVTWASGGFTITSLRTLRPIALAEPFSEVGGQLRGTVGVDGAPELKGERVRVDLLDRRGRILMRREMPLLASAVSFAFPVPEWMPMLVRVEATLLSGRAPAARTYAWFSVTKRNRGQFNFLIWDIPMGTLGGYGAESLARLGTTAILRPGEPPLQARAYDMAWVPYTTRILADHDANGVMLPCCWHDEDAIGKHVSSIVEPHRVDRQSGVFVYSLGDEGVTRGSCVHPACLAAYRDYLRREYRSIEALNASWGTRLASFDEVVLEPADDNNASAAKMAGNYPRWYDRQAYQSYSFTRLCKRFVDGFKEIDPQARVGFEGAGTFDAGDDYDGIVRTNGFWAPYPDMGDEVIRSAAPKGFPRSNWMGYTKDSETLLSKYWRMVTRGCDSVWWWRWDGVGIFHGFLAPHMGPYRATAELVKDTQPVRDGLGTLLIHSRMQHDGIAFVYSMPSAYAVRVEKGPGYGNYATTHGAWSRAVRELGLQYRYVTDRMLRQGEFKPQEYRAVVLSRIEAIGPEEAAVLRRFVANGGTLIADVRPGIFDGHCKPRQAGVLDDVFGVSRTTWNGEAAKGDAVIGKLKIPNAWCDPSVALAGGKAAGRCGDTPVAITHTYGKGRAVLLNVPFTAFPPLWEAKTPRAADAFLAGMFAAAGVKPQVRLLSLVRRGLDAKGERERNVEIVRWRNGDSTLVAVFREAGTRSAAKLVLDKAAQVYDLRSHRSLGRVQSLKMGLIPCRATFFALTAGEEPAVRVALQPAVLQRGQAGKVVLRAGAKSGQRAVLLTARTPDGKEADWLRRVVMVPPDGATVPLPVAHNDPAGKWTLQARELYTNRVTTAAVRVR